MKTYEAIIDGDKVEWVGDRPLLGTGPLRGTFQLADGSSKCDGVDGVELMRVIEQIREDGGINSFGDPVEWQRQARVDRNLPGRNS